MNRIFYMVKAGCTWRLLPHDLPKWKTVYHYFRLFRLSGVLETINQKVREMVREAEGREVQAIAMIIAANRSKRPREAKNAAMTVAKRWVDKNAIWWWIRWDCWSWPK
jgi:transposase